jgi:hypothetical protein
VDLSTGGRGEVEFTIVVYCAAVAGDEELFSFQAKAQRRDINHSFLLRRLYNVSGCYIYDGFDVNYKDPKNHFNLDIKAGDRIEVELTIADKDVSVLREKWVTTKTVVTPGSVAKGTPDRRKCSDSPTLSQKQASGGSPNNTTEVINSLATRNLKLSLDSAAGCVDLDENGIEVTLWEKFLDDHESTKCTAMFAEIIFDYDFFEACCEFHDLRWDVSTIKSFRSQPPDLFKQQEVSNGHVFHLEKGGEVFIEYNHNRCDLLKPTPPDDAALDDGNLQMLVESTIAAARHRDRQ